MPKANQVTGGASNRTSPAAPKRRVAPPVPGRLQTLDQVAATLCISKPQVRVLIKLGVIPPGLSLGPRSTRWPEPAELLRIVAERAEVANRREPAELANARRVAAGKVSRAVAEVAAAGATS